MTQGRLNLTTNQIEDDSEYRNGQYFTVPFVTYDGTAILSWYIYYDSEVRVPHLLDILVNSKTDAIAKVEWLNTWWRV